MERHDENGFTLLQLLTVIAIVAIAGVVAVPAFAATLANQRLGASSTQLMQALTLARSEAIKRNTRVTVRALEGGWGKGWQVFTDSNHNAMLDSGEVLLQQSTSTQLIRINGNRPVKDYVSYTGQGQSESIHGGLQMGTLTICADSGGATPVRAKAIVISSSGRPRFNSDVSAARVCG